jgi:hypothetical protein
MAALGTFNIGSLKPARPGSPASRFYEDRAMELHPDFNELLKLFADFQVD